MNYNEIYPPDELSPFVKCFWEYRCADRQARRHTIFPNGYFELFMIFQNGTLVSVFLSGLRTRPFEVEIPVDVTVSAVRFTLAAAEYVLSREIGSILDATVPLDPGFWDLKRSEALSFAERAAAISDKLMSITSGKKIDPDKLRLLKTVYTPGVSVKDVSEQTGWDRRRINRYFNSRFGLSLKTFMNIIDVLGFQLYACLKSLSQVI